MHSLVKENLSSKTTCMEVRMPSCRIRIIEEHWLRRCMARFVSDSGHTDWSLEDEVKSKNLRETWNKRNLVSVAFVCTKC